MNVASRDFQVFVKPIGAACNLDCHYCYYLKKAHLYPEGKPFPMPDIILEEYIVQHIEASPESVIRFSWHGGEPTILGVHFFRKVVSLQEKHCPAGRTIVNGIQTNGVLLDEEWCRFFAAESFAVGLSLDGPKTLHDRYRKTKGGKPTFAKTMRGYELLKQHGIPTDILCVVNDGNVRHPFQVYRFFKTIGATDISFLPLVEHRVEAQNSVSPRTVPAEAWGDFLCAIFDEWLRQDIGQIKVQIFEEAARTAFDQEHSLCIFRPCCGDIPVIEHNGDFYSCDHYVDENHRLGNIIEIPVVKLLESPRQRAFGQAKSDTLPGCCRSCEVRVMCNGECPKNRILETPDGEPGLNYLCTGYKKFFTRCRPWVEDVAALWRQQNKNTKTSK